jgi:cyclomaltodextrinase
VGVYFMIEPNMCFNKVMTEPNKNSWIHNAVIYQIFVDRFAGYDAKASDMEPEFVGGNLRGITEKVDYLRDLGVNAIWLTPFLKAHDYHGYSTVDFMQVDPHFGTLSDLQEMVHTYHQAGMKVVMDFTANHVSVEHEYFKAAQADPTSPYRDWFYFRDDGSYVSFLSFPALPKLNLDNPAVRDYIISVAQYWLSEGKIDGLRLDHVIGASDDFWRHFVGEVKRSHPGAVIIGEAVFSSVTWNHLSTFRFPFPHLYFIWARIYRRSLHDPILRHYAGIFDGCLDYTFFRLAQKLAQEQLDDAGMRTWLRRHYAKFPPEYVLPSFIENHDSSRYLYHVDNDYERLKQALRIQFDQPQPKVIYYGAEVGMTHSEKVVVNSGWAGDLPARRKMNWEPTPKQLELREFYKDLIRRSQQGSTVAANPAILSS